jgi:hypothetical protein
VSASAWRGGQDVTGLRVGDATVAAAASGDCLRTLLCGACVWVTDDSMRALASVRHPPSRKSLHLVVMREKHHLRWRGIRACLRSAAPACRC